MAIEQVRQVVVPVDGSIGFRSVGRSVVKEKRKRERERTGIGSGPG